MFITMFTLRGSEQALRADLPVPAPLELTVQVTSCGLLMPMQCMPPGYFDTSLNTHHT